MAHPQPEPSNLEWHPVPDGAWERDIDEAELFYKRLAKGNRCHPVTATASFTVLSPNTVSADEVTKRTEAVLRTAWIALCWKHPTLGSRLEHDHGTGRWKRVYTPFTGTHELESWVRLTCQVVDSGGCADQWLNQHSTSPELATLFLVKPNKNAEYEHTVFLQCPHDITDGIGVLQLIHQLFEQATLAYEQGAEYTLPEWGGETARLSPCLRIAADIPTSLSRMQAALFQEIQARNAALYNHPCLLSLPASSKSSAGRTQRRVVSVSRERTENILTRCKRIGPGVSVTHVFTAALAVALSELQPRKDESYPSRYVNHSMINLRPFCHTPYDGPEHAAAAYHTVSAQALSIDVLVPGSDGEKVEDMIASIALSVRDFYKSARPSQAGTEPHEQVVFAPSVFKSLTPPPGVDPHGVSDPPFCPVPLSSLGKVETIVTNSHGPFTLSSVSAFSEPVGAGVALFLGSWEGKLDLSGVFNSRYHDPAYVDDFLQRILDCVYRGLEIADENSGAGDG